MYSDCWVDDARLVVLTAKDAARARRDGAHPHALREAAPPAGRWTATLDRADGSTLEIEARAVVNATGPWVDRFLDDATPLAARHHPRQVKGSHIVVPRLFDHEFAYIFQGADGRIVFAIPYEGDYTLIGTTEMDYTGDLAAPAIAEPEIEYLLAMANRYFSSDLARKDVAWTFAGLRPLLADPKDRATSVTRDYVLDLDTRARRCCRSTAASSPPIAGSPRTSWTCSRRRSAAAPRTGRRRPAAARRRHAAAPTSTRSSRR